MGKTPVILSATLGPVRTGGLRGSCSFTQSWSQEFEILAKPDWETEGLYEYACQENNRCPGGKCTAEN